eukprot:Sspe_Gene.69906::Locus_41261_Transcript_1_1_Confidence_1.000_Length_1489::g.69906::m.69906
MASQYVGRVRDWVQAKPEALKWKDPYVCTTCDSSRVDAVGEYYCAPCGQILCRSCTERLHAHRTLAEFHTIDRVDKEHGVHLVSPLLHQGVVFALLLGMLSLVSIDEAYLRYEPHCPAVESIRGFISRFDSALYHLTKSRWATSCASEDSFWAFFTDMWVRSIVLDTDTWYLFLTQVPAAFMGTAVILIISPVIATVFATVASIIHAVELRATPTMRLRDLEYRVRVAGRWLGLVGRVIGKPMHLLRRPMVEICPPPTLPLRPFPSRSDRVEYHFNAMVRVWRYYYRLSCDLMTGLVYTVVLYTTCIRFLSLWAGAAPALRGAASWMGLHSTIESHRAMLAGDSKKEIVDQLLQTAWKRWFGESDLSTLVFLVVLTAILVNISSSHWFRLQVKKHLSDPDAFHPGWGVLASDLLRSEPSVPPSDHPVRQPSLTPARRGRSRSLSSSTSASSTSSPSSSHSIHRWDPQSLH